MPCTSFLRLHIWKESVFRIILSYWQFKQPSRMKISIAQTKAIKGNIKANIESHKKFIEIATSLKVNAIFFPELSLTGYEPELADSLSNYESDQQLDDFQKISDTKKITIGIGFPTKGEDGIYISMIIFQPNTQRLIYSKQHLFPGEEKFFICGRTQIFIDLEGRKIAPAICYELSVDKHSELAAENKTDIYIASVLNSVNGVDKDLQSLSKIAEKHKMIVFMSNYVGQSGGYNCAGKSSIWDRKGNLIVQLDNETEGILIYDTETELTTEKKITC